MIFCLDGCDAAGKSYHSERLLRLNPDMQHFSFPNYKSETGKLIRDHLNRRWSASFNEVAGVDDPAPVNARLNAIVFQALQSVNKLETTDEIIAADLGADLLITRYWPSAFVYGTCDGLDPAWLLSLRTGLLEPDVFILLDIDPEQTSERRPPAERDRYESDPAYLAKICATYRDLWEAMSVDPNTNARWEVVNARGSKEETEEQIDAIMLEASI